MTRLAPLLIAGAILVLFGSTMLAVAPYPIEVGTAKHLLFDDLLTHSKTGFVTTMNTAVRYDRPVLVADQPWEKRRLGLGQSVVEDEGIYKMWYTAWAEGREWYVCYATSKDGIHWIKPKLGIIEFQGSRENNIVFAGTDRTNYDSQGTVFKDPHETGARRFKFVYSSTLKNPKDAAQLPEVTTWDYSEARRKPSRRYISAAFSPDGLHWTGGARLRIIDWVTDTQDVAFWDDRIRKYVLFVRWNHEQHDRAIGRSESEDFEDFPKPRLVLTSDDLDPIITGLYNSAATKYPYAENAYFLFPSAFYHSRGDVAGSIDGAEPQLAISRDGIQFARPWRRAFLSVGRKGQFDASQVYMSPGLLRVGDDLFLYYTGYWPHHYQIGEPPPNSGGVGMARVRLDGFVSQDAPATGGEKVPSGILTTVPIRFVGARLEVNLDAGAGGWLKVEILDEDGVALPAYSGANSDVLTGNDVRQTVSWKGKSSVSALKGRTVRLRFIGRSVKLYAFQFPT